MFRQNGAWTGLLLLCGFFGLLSLELRGNEISPPLGRVSLEINEAYVDRQVPWPVTAAVPFARGQLADAAQCRLVDETGREHPLQVRVAATWDAARTSVRWLTIDFIAQPDRNYALEFGPGARRQTTPSSLQVEETKEGVRVVTGPIRVDFSPDGPASLREVRADLGDGVLTPVAAGAPDGQHYYLDQEGTRYSSAIPGKDYGEREIVIESAGPVRACIRVDGFYKSPEGEPTVAYRTRYHLFAGLGLIKVVDEFRILGSTADKRWRDIGFALELPEPTGDRTVRAQRSADASLGTVEVNWNDRTRSVSSYQHSYRHVGNPAYAAGVVEVDAGGEQVLSQPDRAGNWIQVTDGHAAITGSLRWFWQQFPKQWQVTEDRLTMHLWTPRAGELDFGQEGALDFIGQAGHTDLIDQPQVRSPRHVLQDYMHFGGFHVLERGEADGQGIRKHHELYFHFGPAKEASRNAEYGRLADQPPLALATGAWNTATDVFGPLIPRPNRFDAEEAIVDRIFDLGRYAQHAYGDYGWWFFGSGPHYAYSWDEATQRHHADPMRFEYHTYQKEMQLWWNYFRSGERKFFDWALPAENHWIDIAVAHVPLTFRADWRGGVPEPGRILSWRAGDWSIDGPVHYLRHHDTAEAWLRGGDQFWATYHRSLETTTLAYYLTGDERFNDVIAYWRDYWADLAGVHSGSEAVQPWHREQPWFQPTEPDEPGIPWAEMIRDYAPFQSGSRHQLTLLFNLATLYEHTWDPAIGQVLQEYADAFLDPGHAIGVWRTNENSLPANAEAPDMAHFWAPALWKYARVTGDPRMDEVFARYFDAAYGADPIRQNVGRYSTAHPAYAYALTKDPRHLRAATVALRELLPHAAPLEEPQDLRARLYNPFTPIEVFTTVPRLLWAIDQAEQSGIEIEPDAPMTPQRTAIALSKQAGEPLRAEIWSFDPLPTLLGPGGEPFESHTLQTQTYATRQQPFDRTTPEFTVHLHTLEIDRSAPPGFYLLAPGLETAVLSVEGGDTPVLANAARPLATGPGEAWTLRAPEGQHTLTLQGDNLGAIRVLGPEGPLSGRSENQAWVYPVKPGQTYRVANDSTRRCYLRVADWPAPYAWAGLDATIPDHLPGYTATLAALPPLLEFDAEARFIDGRFDGQALLVVPGREVHLPDHVVIEDDPVQLFDMKEGTLEFWVKRLWDDRLRTMRRVTFLDNGLLSAWDQWPLPVGEWAHIAIVWRPYLRDPSLTAVHIYVNGLDRMSYRNTWWEGYGRRPPTFTDEPGQWLGHFVLSARPGAAFAIDDLHLSAVPRYAPVEVELGSRQSFNPLQFDPPDTPGERDEHTLLHYSFDGDLGGVAPRLHRSLQGVFVP